MARNGSTKLIWKKRITQCTKDAGTYKPYFDDVIDTLADILYRRDQALESFKQSGEGVIVPHVNKAGAENFEQHPALRIADNLNRDALQYWKELGLTPAALRKMNEDSFKPKQVSKFASALAALSGEADD